MGGLHRPILISQLINRGYDVIALARSAASSSMIQSLGATAVPGDITDKESMRAAMADSDVVFHCCLVRNWPAGPHIGRSDQRRRHAQCPTWLSNSAFPNHLHQHNGHFGDTHGKIVDETYIAAGPFDTEYERTKWLAHYKVAVP